MADKLTPTGKGDSVKALFPLPRPIRKLFGLHIHDWVHAETVELPGGTYQAGPIIVTAVPRSFHYRRCTACEAVEQYYPTEWEAPSPWRGVGEIAETEVIPKLRERMTSPSTDNH
jgi:hypothetical protein